MLYLLEMISDDDKYRNDNELLKDFYKSKQEMYEDDIKNGFDEKPENYDKIPMFEENQFLYDTKTGKLYKAEKYMNNLLKTSKNKNRV